ncbi:MAG: flagellar export chaperone FlgN [Lachnospiraceae bacterium]|nr:flagellar export chaperone FlgN [Lachnospiraceae bacterium]
MTREEFSTCFKVLEDTIQKKEQYLDELLTLTKEQESILLQDIFKMDGFTECMDKKEPYIKKITEFDAGFEAVFAKMKPVMETYKSEFEARIRVLQQRIKTVLEKGAALCTLEEQNKIRLEHCLKDKKQEIKNFKRSSNTVSSYYKNMSGALTDQSFFMDKKK